MYAATFTRRLWAAGKDYFAGTEVGQELAEEFTEPLAAARLALKRGSQKLVRPYNGQINNSKKDATYEAKPEKVIRGIGFACNVNDAYVNEDDENTPKGDLRKSDTPESKVYSTQILTDSTNIASLPTNVNTSMGYHDFINRIFFDRRKHRHSRATKSPHIQKNETPTQPEKLQPKITLSELSYIDRMLASPGNNGDNSRPVYTPKPTKHRRGHRSVNSKNEVAEQIESYLLPPLDSDLVDSLSLDYKDPNKNPPDTGPKMLTETALINIFRNAQDGHAKYKLESKEHDRRHSKRPWYRLW